MNVKKIKDPVSALTHFVALLACIPVTVFLILKGVFANSPVHIVAFSIFGASLILLYTASTLYHSINISEKVSTILRRIDHIMIFVLIAGSYTPICLITLKGAWGYTLLSLVWSIAALGIVFKVFFINAPRKITTFIYVAMGWLVVIAFVPLVKSISVLGLILLATGGIVYSAGAVIYATKKPKLNFKFFGFHEVFHVFVMVGSAFHIVLMFKCI